VYCMVFVLLMILIMDFSHCTFARIKLWLAVQFVINLFEAVMQEVKERMSDSLWWQEHRRIKKVVLFVGVGCKELAEVIWTIYGWSLFWGAARNEASP